MADRLRINISKEEAERILEWLPGDRQLWEDLTDTFLHAYAPWDHAPAKSDEDHTCRWCEENPDRCWWKALRNG